ncbi:transglycosylase domain-containing protein [Frigoribacterium sp. CFBP9039]|uniref:transglycosylase domain-containing protein n=1 Tax=Frigoribacterium TaxID=96492 RepID=UPI001785A075|nr:MULTISPECIES: transglycosylase domain-containing protein [Frigoribacterium]MBD8702552.1 transglycosylase domain-containing protein [Frigoribacterium sp. CFBP 13712]MCJ0699830.1 transglycosylase domain-containing protein [Frigoribacterium faeni]MDY0891163.1 transglycosylase domain-containing protein [Frigoribacterium sp. CFBP9030]MDY0944541.1 transglycosylase domain-containing protein [Frigoribacterium sp. CFBP9039]
MSDPKSKPTSVVGALFGFVGFSVLAGLLVTIGVTPAIAVAGMTASSSIGVFESIPEYIEIGKLQQRNVLYGKQNGQDVPFATLYAQNRVALKWEEVSPNLKNAVVAGEDRRFYEHGGVDLTSLVRAGVGSLAGGLGESGGGSTLTMQLVRNIRLAEAQGLTGDEQAKAIKEAKEVSIDRKLQEMKFAIGLEKKYSKDDILLAYLNIAYFGDQAYGVQAASQHYYNKAASDLTATEAASLIAMVQYPEKRNLGTPDNYQGNVDRRNVILASMLGEKYIDQETYDAAVVANPADYVKLTTPSQGCTAVTAAGAQQFCDYVKKSIKDIPSLGADAEEREANWSTGGYKVYTTINLDLTASARAQIDRYAPPTESALILGSAVNSVEAGTGRVIVMAQNRNLNEDPEVTDPNVTAINYSTDKPYGGSGGFQTGSTYKPFTLIDWLQNGHGLSESVNGRPRPFTPMTFGGESLSTVSSDFPQGFAPKNDDGRNPGYVTAQRATALSINTAYAAMAQKLDLRDIRDVATSLGVHRADGTELQYQNPSSFLGTNEIAPLTMAAAYAGIAAGGKYCKPIIVDQIVDADGQKIGGQPQECNQALDPEIAAATIQGMSQLWSNGGTGVGGLPYDGYPEIGKTGTTTEKDQIWLIGSTSKLATAVWMGNVKGKVSLRSAYSPATGTTYANARAGFFRDVQTVNNTVYPGTAFPVADPSVVRGTSSLSVPDVTGKTAEEAATSLRALGLSYVDGGRQKSEQPLGTVTTTSPSAGSRVSSGTSVTVYTSDGGNAVTVPDVVGDSFDDAVSALAGTGFEAANVSVAGYVKGSADNVCQVVASDPAAGSTVDRTGPVRLQLYGDAEGKDPGNCT